MTAGIRGKTFWAASFVGLMVPVPFIAFVGYESFVNGVAPPADLMLVVTLVTLGFLQLGVVRLRVEPWGVRISKAPWGFPRRTYRRDEIASVRPVRVPVIGAGLRKRGIGFYCVRPGSAIEFHADRRIGIDGLSRKGTAGPAA